METRKLIQKVNEIEMPLDMKERLLRNCELEMEGDYMRLNSNRKQSAKKKLVLAASLALCLCLAGVTGLAMSGKLEGYFKDITRFDGAVIGSTYEQAADEIEVSLDVTEQEIILNIKMLYPDKMPYTTFDEFGISSYQIKDKNDKVIMESAEPELVKVESGGMSFIIPADQLVAGEYSLVITSFVGASKADQPLELHGNWVCDFVIE